MAAILLLVPMKDPKGDRVAIDYVRFVFVSSSKPTSQLKAAITAVHCLSFSS
jgi:hypothetical protein